MREYDTGVGAREGPVPGIPPRCIVHVFMRGFYNVMIFTTPLMAFILLARMVSNTLEMQRFLLVNGFHC